MKGDLYCYGGRVMRSDETFDDPYLVTDIGQCEDCDGEGCSKNNYVNKNKVYVWRNLKSSIF